MLPIGLGCDLSGLANFLCCFNWSRDHPKPLCFRLHGNELPLESGLWNGVGVSYTPNAIGAYEKNSSGLALG